MGCSNSREHKNIEEQLNKITLENIKLKKELEKLEEDNKKLVRDYNGIIDNLKSMTQKIHEVHIIKQKLHKAQAINKLYEYTLNSRSSLTADALMAGLKPNSHDKKFLENILNTAYIMVQDKSKNQHHRITL
jgi:predicted RNase H-like nuclease (RuvC/YqgF family)